MVVKIFSKTNYTILSITLGRNIVYFRMGKKSNLVVTHSDEELQKWHRKTRNTKYQKRVQAIIYLKDGGYGTQKEIAKLVGAGLSTLERWIGMYKQDGLAALCEVETRNKPSKLITPDIFTWLEQVLYDNSAPVKGYKHLQMMIKEKFNKDIPYFALYYYVRQHFRTKLKSPRKSHYKKDEQAVDAFLKTTARDMLY